MKKTFLVSIMLATVLLSGCQAAPNRQSVVNKQDKITPLYETQSAGNNESVHVQTSKDFMSTDNSVQFHLSIDQEFETDRMPVVEVVPRRITSEDSERVAKALLGDVAFYEREPSSNPKFSKSQYQGMISRLAPYSNLDAMTDLVGVDNAESMLESVKQGINSLTEAMETAPEENPHIPCDWIFKKERNYNNSDQDIGNRALGEDDDWLVATAEKDGMGYTYMVISRNQPDYKLNRFNLQLGGASVYTSWDRQIYWSKLCRTGAPTQQKLQAIQEKVTNLLTKLDLGLWRVADTEVVTYGTDENPEYLVYVHATPILNGIPAVYGQENTQKSNDYTGAYAITQATFLMSSNGDLLGMELDSPLEIKSLINENVEKLSLPQLLERAQNHLELSDAGNFGLPADQVAIYEQHFEEAILCHVTIDKAEYGLARIMAENTTDCYYYVPALMLHGDIEYRGESSGTAYFNNANKHILCINAVDGSIIG